MASWEGLFRRVPQLPLPGMFSKQKRSGREWSQDKEQIREGRGQRHQEQVQGKKKAGICLP